MNSKQITACIGAGCVMFGLLVLVARRSTLRLDPNDSVRIDSRTAALMSSPQAEFSQELMEANDLSKKAGQEATNLFKLPSRISSSDTNEHFFQVNRAEEGDAQPAGEGFLPGPPPRR